MINQNPEIMYKKDERGLLVPLLVGGLAGYAIGRPNYYPYPQQVPYYPQPYPCYPPYCRPY